MMTVYPIEGRFLGDVAPPVPLTVTNALGDRLVRTGAFTTDQGSDDRVPLSFSIDGDPARQAGLDFYDPPVAFGEHYVKEE